jgi:metal-responsive CopG/Arc/MetJ family transcriptional regulator
LPEEAWEELDRRCAEQRVSKSELIRELILEHFAEKAGKPVDE